MTTIKRGENAIAGPEETKIVKDEPKAEEKPFEPKIAEEPTPEGKGNGGDAKPEPKVVAAVLVEQLDNGQVRVQRNATLDVALILLGQGRKITAQAIAQGKE